MKTSISICMPVIHFQEEHKMWTALKHPAREGFCSMAFNWNTCKTKLQCKHRTYLACYIIILLLYLQSRKCRKLKSFKKKLLLYQKGKHHLLWRSCVLTCWLYCISLTTIIFWVALIRQTPLLHKVTYFFCKTILI